jgi:hypothetical protein
VLALVGAQFRDFMNLALLAAACIAGVTGDVHEAFAIAGLVLLNGAIGLIQSIRAEHAMAELRKLAPLDAMVRNDLLEMIDDRSAGKATIVTSQLPIERWHGWIGDETIADAMLDRLMQRHHRIKLTGESLRKPSPKPSVLEPELGQN